MERVGKTKTEQSQKLFTIAAANKQFLTTLLIIILLYPHVFSLIKPEMVEMQTFFLGCSGGLNHYL